VQIVQSFSLLTACMAAVLHADTECLASLLHLLCLSVAGFARPQPRAVPSPASQQQHTRAWVPSVQREEIAKADALLAGVRARHAGLVEQQLRHLILTQPLATDNVWQKVCQVCVTHTCVNV
jgi:hypothetical protein